MWVPKRHLLECTIYQYEKEDGEGIATELRREFKSRYAEDPVLGRAISSYERFNNVKRATPKMLLHSGKGFAPWADQKPIVTGMDTAAPERKEPARDNIASYDASMSLAGLPNTKPEERLGVGVCRWGDRWFKKNKPTPDKITIKLPERTIGKGKDGNWFPNISELEKWARAIAYACFYASPFVDRKEMDRLYIGIYQRFCEKGKFAEDAFN